MDEKNVKRVARKSSYSTEELFDAVIALNAALHSLSSMLSVETGLALSDLVANEHVRLHGPLSAKEVAHRVQMGSGATTALIDRLVKRGFVTRVPHPTDRRSILVQSLARETTDTPKLGAFLQVLAARIARVPAAERRAIAAFLDGVAEDAMATLNDGRDATPT